MTFATFAFVVAITLVGACLLLMLALIVVRVHHDRAEHRRVAVRAPLWPLVLTLGVGEPDEVDAAQKRLLALNRAERSAIEDDAWAMVPKLRGDARERLREVLQRWGGVDEARYSTSSRSPVRRARGYYRLGILAEPARLDQLMHGVEDHDFTARRTAVLALGAFAEERVVEAILRAAADDVPLRRDFLASVDRIGLTATPVLRRHLAAAPAPGERDARERLLAAEALGLVGDLEDAPVLETALAGALDTELDTKLHTQLHTKLHGAHDTGGEEAPLAIACLHSLGMIGSPTSIRTAAEALTSASAQVRRAAAACVGLIGSPQAISVLEPALSDPDVEVARAAANALRRSGPAGTAILELSQAPVAAEVLALAALGAGP